MPFVPVEETTSNLPDVPFISDWSKRKANDGSTFVVCNVLLCSKGLILFTEEFKVFIWKSEKFHNAVLERIGESFDPEEPKDSVAVQVAVSTKKCFIAGFDSDVQGSWSEDGSVYTFTSSNRVPSMLPTMDSVPKSAIDRAPRNARRAS